MHWHRLKAFTGSGIIKQGREVLSGVSKKVPYNTGRLAKEYGVQFEKKFIPFAPYVVTDGKLLTGQNPFSAELTAQAMIKVLEGNTA